MHEDFGQVSSRSTRESSRVKALRVALAALAATSAGAAFTGVDSVRRAHAFGQARDAARRTLLQTDEEQVRLEDAIDAEALKKFRLLRADLAEIVGRFDAKMSGFPGEPADLDPLYAILADAKALVEAHRPPALRVHAGGAAALRVHAGGAA